MDDYLRDTVSVRKDVEGLCNTYRRNLYHNIRCGSSMVCSLVVVVRSCLIYYIYYCGVINSGVNGTAVSMSREGGGAW